MNPRDNLPARVFAAGLWCVVLFAVVALLLALASILA